MGYLILFSLLIFLSFYVLACITVYGGQSGAVAYLNFVSGLYPNSYLAAPSVIAIVPGHYLSNGVTCTITGMNFVTEHGTVKFVAKDNAHFAKFLLLL